MNAAFQELLKKIIKEQSLYKSVRLINDTLIIVLFDGEVLSKVGATEEDYNAVINAISLTNIKKQIGDGEEEDVEKVVEKTTSMSEMKKTIKKRMVKF